MKSRFLGAKKGISCVCATLFAIVISGCLTPDLGEEPIVRGLTHGSRDILVGNVFDEREYSAYLSFVNMLASESEGYLVLRNGKFSLVNELMEDDYLITSDEVIIRNEVMKYNWFSKVESVFDLAQSEAILWDRGILMKAMENGYRPVHLHKKRQLKFPPRREVIDRAVAAVNYPVKAYGPHYFAPEAFTQDFHTISGRETSDYFGVAAKELLDLYDIKIFGNESKQKYEKKEDYSEGRDHAPRIVKDYGIMFEQPERDNTSPLKNTDIMEAFLFDVWNYRSEYGFVMRYDSDNKIEREISPRITVAKIVYYRILSETSSLLADEYNRQATKLKPRNDLLINRKGYLRQQLARYYGLKQEQWEDYARKVLKIKVAWTDSDFQVIDLDTKESAVFSPDDDLLAEALKQLNYVRHRMDLRSDFQVENYPMFLLSILRTAGVNVQFSEQSNEYVISGNEFDAQHFFEMVSELGGAGDDSSIEWLRRNLTAWQGTEAGLDDLGTSPSWERTFDLGSCNGISVLQASGGKYIIATTADDFLCKNALIKTDSNGDMEWRILSYALDAERLASMQLTHDGGCIIVGWVNRTEKRDMQLLLAKVDSRGILEWKRIIDGPGKCEYGFSVWPTDDEGFIIAGRIEEFRNTHRYQSQIWLVKTDAQGKKQWDRVLRSEQWEEPHAVIQISGGNYVIAGGTENPGAEDIFLTKTDAEGRRLWRKTFGSDGRDVAYDMIGLPDGGFVLAGKTSSYGSTHFAGRYDFWVLRTDSEGNLLWDKTFGGFMDDIAYDVSQCSDDGYIIAGQGMDIKGHVNALLIKVDSQGDEEWRQVLGGSHHASWARSIQQTTDGGYICTGRSPNPNAGVWLFKIYPPDK